MAAGKGIRGGSAVAGLVLLSAGLAPGSAAAAPLVAEGSTTAAAACGLSLGSVTAGGDQVRRQATATVVGIDKDTRSAYLYAVGHANGTATVIQSRGKLPGAFADPTYFRWGWEPDQLNGE